MIDTVPLPIYLLLWIIYNDATIKSLDATVLEDV